MDRRQNITTAKGSIMAFKEKIDSMDPKYVKRIGREVLRLHHSTRKRTFTIAEKRALNFLIDYCNMGHLYKKLPL